MLKKTGKKRTFKVLFFKVKTMDFMEEALKEARKAESLGEIPVGCVVVKNGKVTGRGHNLKETLSDPSSHAEMNAIREACREEGNWRLTNTEIYISLEPCPMCMSLITQARISRVIIGCPSVMSGACGTVIDLTRDPMSGFSPEVIWDVRKEASELIENFFSGRRT